MIIAKIQNDVAQKHVHPIMHLTGMLAKIQAEMENVNIQMKHNVLKVMLSYEKCCILKLKIQTIILPLKNLLFLDNFSLKEI